MCAELLGQKSRATAVTATGKMTSPRGYARINTHECLYSIPKTPLQVHIYTKASWSERYKFDLLSSLKGWLSPPKLIKLQIDMLLLTYKLTTAPMSTKERNLNVWPCKLIKSGNQSIREVLIIFSDETVGIQIKTHFQPKEEVYPAIHPFSFFLLSRSRDRLTLGTSHQHLPRPHWDKDTFGQFTISNWPRIYVFRLWEEALKSCENPLISTVGQINLMQYMHGRLSEVLTWYFFTAVTSKSTKRFILFIYFKKSKSEFFFKKIFYWPRRAYHYLIANHYHKFL